MYETRASEDMDPPVLGSRILTRLIVLYVMGFNNKLVGFACKWVTSH